MRALRSCLSHHQPMPIDAEATKRVGWQEHGILVVADQNPRLTRPERKLVGQLGTKLYGRRWEGDR
jgi:hypothetical protein